MIKICAWHKYNFGFVLHMGAREPFEDKSETHGICSECASMQQPYGDKFLELMLLRAEVKRQTLVYWLNRGACLRRIGRRE